ncbi:MAG: hypothetical protein GY847_16815 [Proteobacteria bacterium]|nr:hypothetical protein [Pseudomonadota bacterium]
MTEKGKIISGVAAPLSPHTKALLKAGERLLTESVETGREFCKSMIGISLTAIPIYVGLVKAFVPKDKIIMDLVGLIWVFPVGLFILAAVILLTGYMPGRNRVSIELPGEIEETLNRAINRRFWVGVIGFIMLCAAIVAGVVVLAKL